MSYKQSRGFSLVELMIVVAIIGILATVALGFYGDNVIASNRTEGRSALQQAAGTLEKCRSLYGSYNHVNCNYADFASESNYYDITSAILGTTFTLTATPVVGQSQARDTDCTTMTLTNAGVKGGTGASSADCW
ncbi:MAG: prepilin-type N-terminal cleavage/methylation domain-containing protein [Gammaproteobacteria bacterium]|nr:prepilin-type N-terminal cleavage/methylation domain-containing protein [Gammaproteobacteria bacterium]